MSGTERLTQTELFPLFFRNIRQVCKRDRLGKEIMGIALPAIFILAINPIATIVQTASLGRLGSVELEAVKASNTGYNLAVNLFTFALAIITASFVAKEKALGTTGADRPSGSVEVPRVGDPIPNDEVVPAEGFSRGRQRLPSASTAMVVAFFLGLLLILAAMFGAESILVFMGAKSDSSKLTIAARYLKLRSLGAPANLLSSAAQGAFVGLKDTMAPLYAIAAGELANIALHPVLVFSCDMGFIGAAIAHAISQYMIFGIILWKLTKKIDLLHPSFKDMQFWEFINKGILLLLREIAITSCPSLAAILAARLDSTPRAAIETCLKIWAASSVIAGGFAISSQAILAGALADKDYGTATAATFRLFKMGFVLGLVLAGIVGVALFGYGAFAEDVNVKHLLFAGIPFVGATLAMNSWGCVLDGIIFGASDFTYATYSMILISITSITVLFDLVESDGFTGMRVALATYMGMRTAVGLLGIGFGTGSWSFLRDGPHRL